VIERAAVLFLWRNFHKPFSENHGGGTPAMRRGLYDHPLGVRQLLQPRRFPARIRLPEPWLAYYRRLVPTIGIPRPRTHALKLAY
jgi:glycine cleavage system protein P-like pyridoxal-binding family